MPAPAPAPRYRRDTATWIAFACLFGFGLLNAVLGPALPYLRAAEGLSYLAASAHQVAFAVGGGIAGLLAAAVSRAMSRRRAIATGLGMAALAGLGIGYGPSAYVTILAAFVLSLCGTTALIRLWALLADLHQERRTVAMSEGEVCVSLAGILTPVLIGGLAATALSWRAATAVTSVVVAATAVLVLVVPFAEQRERAPAAAVTKSRWRQPMLVVVVAVVALEFCLSFWLASFLDDEVGLGRDLAVAMSSVLYAAALAGRLLVSRLARRIAAEPLLVSALFLTVVGAPLLLIAHGPVLAIAGIVVTGIGMGATFPLTSSLHVQASSISADAAMGQVLAVAAIGQIAGPLATGVLAQVADLRVGLLLLPTLSALGLVALALHHRNVQHHRTVRF
jgi:MFS family permease